MEEQPIDKLFKRKLAEAEIKPSNAAWSALQAKRGQARMGLSWVYMAMAVAASIILISSFGWWKLKPGETDVVAAMEEKRMPIKITKPSILSAEKLASRAYKVEQREKEQIQINAQVNDVLAKSNVREKPQKTERVRLLKDNSELMPQVAMITNASDIKDTKIHSTEIKEIVASIPVSRESKPQISERTLMVSIALPEKAMPVSTEIETKAIGNTPKNGFRNLLKKVKELKGGDLMALNNEEAVKPARRGLGKFYEEVKESIKNNSTDE